MLQIRNGYALVYNQPEYDSSYIRPNRHLMLNNFKDKAAYSGTITASTQKRISRTVDLLLQKSPEIKKHNPVTNRIIKHRLSFITLTIPDTKKMYTAKEAYSLLLAPFLRYMRDKKYITTYIWKAELQARGQIHYHITTPSIIHYNKIKEYWNSLMSKNKMLDDYYSKHKHYNPNSTDIHQVKKLDNIQAYLTKYLSKTEQNQTPTTGKLWDCSLDIKGAKFFSRPLNKYHCHNILSAHKNNNLSVVDLENCSVLKTKNIKPSSLLTPVERKDYQQHLDLMNNKVLSRKAKHNNTPVLQEISNEQFNSIINKPAKRTTTTQTKLLITADIDTNKFKQKLKSKRPL